MELADYKLADTPGPSHREDMRPTSSNPSSPSPPRYGWTSERIAQHSILSHSLCLMFGIPSLTLFALDLHAYASQVHHPKTPSSNLITNLDGIALAFLSLTVIYATLFLVFYRQIRRLLTPAFLRRHLILISLTIHVLSQPLFVVSVMSLAQRAYASNCQVNLRFDAGACDGHRRTIVKGAGAMGVLTR
jgi:hypothetical protein